MIIINLTKIKEKSRKSSLSFILPLPWRGRFREGVL